eukprot:CAMPEP_0116879780 /NCGR_PEP_ID=MMETSP0463-20121206/11612_1 /TAXON_ID=181622 /ORGANISM="Strombidinopsis sp, Strain SopsisLIS2011" /LENGTH=51 /DNA_ID=CAMNT_0004529507 /DNA_START=179 /DNA_END=334 /DNA_ORIENTATION=+
MRHPNSRELPLKNFWTKCGDVLYTGYHRNGVPDVFGCLESNNQAKQNSEKD